MRKMAVLRLAQLKHLEAAGQEAGSLALNLVGTGSCCERADAGRVVQYLTACSTGRGQVLPFLPWEMCWRKVLAPFCCSNVVVLNLWVVTPLGVEQKLHIRCLACQICTLRFITVANLQLQCSSDNNGTAGGHHDMNCIKGSQH